MTDRPVWIFGAGDLARLARGYFEHDLGRKVAGFVVDDEYRESVAQHTSGICAWSEYVSAIETGSAELFPAVGYRSMRERARVRKAGSVRACHLQPRLQWLENLSFSGAR